MNAVRIKKTLDSPIPELPELASMIGKTVEIIVLEADGVTSGFWDSPSIEELIVAQGVDPVGTLANLIGWPDEGDDGFDDALVHWRREAWSVEPA